MANIWAKFISIRLVFGKSSPLLKTVVAAAIALSTVVLVTLRLSTWEAEEQLQKLQQRAAILEMENAQLQQQVDELGTVESIRTIAARELGLVEPGTIIIENE